MINQHITDYLNYYTNLKNSPEFAVFLRGEWGSGKTKFIKDYLNTITEPSGIYISLNGVNSYADIEDQIFRQLHPILGSAPFRITGKILKGILKTTIKVDLDGDGTNEGSITSSAPEDLGIPKYLQNLDNRVLIFDDLERCSIPIPDVLGFINQFVEDKGLKVIVIGNERQIIEDEEKISPTKSKEFKSIKEKLIGKSLTIEPDFDVAYSDFINQLEDAAISKILEANMGLIKSIFHNSGYGNLRHLRQTILDFERFHELLPNDLAKKSGLLEHIISLFFLLGFELKKGLIDENKIHHVFHPIYIGPKANEPKTPELKVREKYPVFQKFDHPIGSGIFYSFFHFGTANKEMIETSVKSSVYYQDENTLDWIKLSRYWQIDDEVFEDLSQKVYQELEECKLEDKYAVMQCAGLFIHLIHEGVVSLEIETVINSATKNLETLVAEKKFQMKKHENFPSTMSHGLEYRSLGSPEFQAFLKEAKEIGTKSIINDQPENVETLIKTMSTSMADFQEAMTLSNSANNLFYDIPILKYLDLDRFMEAFISLSNDDKREFSFVIHERYRHEDFNKKLLEELDWLKEFNKRVLLLAELVEGKVSGLVYKFLSLHVNVAIDTLMQLEGLASGDLVVVPRTLEVKKPKAQPAKKGTRKRRTKS